MTGIRVAEGQVTRDEAATPPAAVRGGKSVQRCAAIIRAAIEVINEKSYALATMSDIAATLGLRDAALYYYFESKQALAYACHVHSLETLERLLDIAARDGRTGFDRLGSFIRDMLDDAGRHGPQLYFGDYSYLTAEQRHRVRAWADRLTGTLEQFIETGIADGSIVPCEARIAVQLLLGMLIWLAKWVPSMPGLTVDRLVTSIGVVAFDGLRAGRPGSPGGHGAADDTPGGKSEL